jgi:hypothetical protein
MQRSLNPMHLYTCGSSPAAAWYFPFMMFFFFRSPGGRTEKEEH